MEITIKKLLTDYTEHRISLKPILDELAITSTIKTVSYAELISTIYSFCVANKIPARKLVLALINCTP